MQMNKGLDTGAMILKATCNITSLDTSASIYDKLAELGPEALIETLALMSEDKHKIQPQDNNLATHAAKLDKADAELDWQLPAKALHQKLRAYIPWPVAQFTFTDEKQKQHKIRVWQASVVENKSNALPGTIISTEKSGITIATGEQALCLEKLQLPGKKPLSCQDILNGRADWFKVDNSINGFKQG